jgi:hypothetical protein
MANQALQMLVVAAISWLLVGQSQAAGPTRREPAPHHNDEILTQEQLLERCTHVAMRVLEQVAVPFDVSEYVRLSRLYLRNIFDAYRNPGDRERYIRMTTVSGAQSQAVINACANFIAIVEVIVQQRDAECVEIGFQRVLGEKHEAIVTRGQISLMEQAEALMICYIVMHAPA